MQAHLKTARPVPTIWEVNDKAKVFKRACKANAQTEYKTEKMNEPIEKENTELITRVLHQGGLTC